MGALLDLAHAALESDAVDVQRTPTKAELRRQRVLAMLEKSPGIKYALITDTDSDPDSVLLTLAIRGKATCELQIPRDRYDGFLLLNLNERHKTVH